MTNDSIPVGALAPLPVEALIPDSRDPDRLTEGFLVYEIPTDYERLRARGASQDSTFIDDSLHKALVHLLSTPGQSLMHEAEYAYKPTPPQAYAVKKVRFRFLGAGQPLPIHEDDEEQ